MKCPICKESTGYYQQEQVKPGTFKKRPYPLYQRDYPGEPGYISPRCEGCDTMSKKVTAEVADLGGLADLCRLYPDTIKNMEVTLAPQWVSTQLGREVWNGEKGILGAIVTFEPISESDLVEAFNDLGTKVGVELERLEKKKLITRISGKVTPKLLEQLGDVVSRRSK